MKNDMSSNFDDNWLGELRLNFSLKNGRSILANWRHIGPFCVQRSFYPTNDEDTPHVYLIHPSGGLVGGDKLILRVFLGSNSSALLTTPGSTKFYKTNGMYAEQEYIFKLSNNTALEWIPQSSIFFPKTKAKMHTVFELSQGAKMISYEILCFNSLKIGSYNNPEEIDISTHIILPNSVGLRDRLRMNASNYIKKLSGFQISAVLFAVPADEVILKNVRRLIGSINKSVQIGSATLLDELLVVRLLSHDSQTVKILFRRIWGIIRPIVIGKQSVIPRIWFT